MPKTLFPALSLFIAATAGRNMTRPAYVAVAVGITIYVHQTRTLEPVTSWRVKHCYTPQLAWSPDRRLLAHTYIWQGLTHCNRFFDDPDAARLCYDQVITLSKGDHGDSAWEDWQMLKAKVLRRGSVNPTAARLARGVPTGEKRARWRGVAERG